jgi:two-component system nitrate/nitrite response regulator NarL
MPNGPFTARIFIISEPAIYRDGLRLLLGAEPGFHVVGSAADCVEALQTARQAEPDILLLDLATPVPSDPTSLSALARACAPARIILLVPSLDRNHLPAALLDGVRGVVMKDVSSDDLFRSVRAVAAGQWWIGYEVMADLIHDLFEMARSGSAPTLQPQFGLSPRELDIVAALAAGCVNKQIAKRFGISEKTVKHHLTQIFEKLGLSNRLEVALFALHHGLVSYDPAFESRGAAGRSVRAPKTPRI